MATGSRAIAFLLSASFSIAAVPSYAQQPSQIPLDLRPFFTIQCTYKDGSALPTGCVCNTIAGKISEQCDAGSCQGHLAPLPLPSDPRRCNPNLPTAPR
jgi:hypothetical protein